MREEIKGPQTRTQSVWISPKMVRLSALFEPFKYQTIKMTLLLIYKWDDQFLNT